jgi:hypothetical protein
MKVIRLESQFMLNVLDASKRVSLPRQPVIPTAHYSDDPLFRQPIIPTAHYSDGPFFRQCKIELNPQIHGLARCYKQDVPSVRLILTDHGLEISNRHKKPKLCTGPSNDHSWAVWFQLYKWFQRRSVLKHFPHRVHC